MAPLTLATNGTAGFRHIGRRHASLIRGRRWVPTTSSHLTNATSSEGISLGAVLGARRPVDYDSPRGTSGTGAEARCSVREGQGGREDPGGSGDKGLVHPAPP